MVDPHIPEFRGDLGDVTDVMPQELFECVAVTSLRELNEFKLFLFIQQPEAAPPAVSEVACEGEPLLFFGSISNG